MKKRRPPITRTLLRNANAALMAAVEIHNKPHFQYRYEVCVLLVINAWELMLKAYIHRYDRRVKLFRDDGTTKDFSSCVACVAGHLGKDFEATRESLERLYDYRNNAAHFFWEKLDVILLALLSANVLFYVAFQRRHFDAEIANHNSLVLLPIGFKKPFSPVDFLTEESALSEASVEVRRFIQSIVDSASRLQKAGVPDSILLDFSMNLINEKRISNADIIAGIRNDGTAPASVAINNIITGVAPTDRTDAKVVRVSEESLFTSTYTVEYATVIAEAKRQIPNFKQGATFNKLMASVKGNPTYHKVRLLNPNKPNSGKKDWYSKEIHAFLAQQYPAAAQQQSLPLAEQTGK